MKIYIYIAGRLHGMRNWTAVPRVGEDVHVDAVILPDGRKGERALKVIAVLWNEETIDVNLAAPEH